MSARVTRVGWASIACVILLSSEGVATAAAARTPAPRALTEFTTVTTTNTAYLRVVVPRPLNFAASGELERPTLTLTGGAIGWMLKLDVRGFTPFASFLRMPAEEGGSVQFNIDGIDPKTNERVNDRMVLPAGVYRLYAFAGGRGTVRLRLPGLAAGETRLQAATSTPLSTATFVVPANPVAAPTYASGVTIDASRARVMLFAFDWVRTTVQASAHYGECVYRDRPPQNTWAPACPGGDNVVTNVFGIFRGCCGTANGGAYFQSGTWSLGRWYVASGVVERAGMYYVWLPDR